MWHVHDREGRQVPSLRAGSFWVTCVSSKALIASPCVRDHTESVILEKVWKSANYFSFQTWKIKIMSGKIQAFNKCFVAE